MAKNEAEVEMIWVSNGPGGFWLRKDVLYELQGLVGNEKIKPTPEENLAKSKQLQRKYENKN